MLVHERYEKIVQLVNERGSIRVSELSEIFQVTEETIRRDLDRLEQAGRLRRSHGGAMSVRDQVEIPYFEREIAHVEEKRRIAIEAIQQIKPHDRILLDASTTAWYVAVHLPDMPLTVLTNSLKVTTELSVKEKVEIITTGGLFTVKSQSFVGPLAERSLDAYHVDKAFLSCQGIHIERGISESNELQARVKQKMIGMANTVYLLADSSKFKVQAFTRFADINQIDTIITDRHVPEDLVEQLQERSIQVMRV